jgi:uncharacterized protein (TIGR00661 family)
MRILYGVQCSGNGHLSRAREIVSGLRRRGHHVHVILSGRDPAQLSDVGVLRPLTAFHGVYCHIINGGVDYFGTAQLLDLPRFARDIRSVDASGFDIVVTDFEPITSRVARRDGIPSVAIGHQYSFMFDVPSARGNAIGRAVLKHSAPADTILPLHWHHWGYPILPPVLPTRLESRTILERKILVYLPFENKAELERVLSSLGKWDFFVYGHTPDDHHRGNIAWRAFSRSGFLADLADCSGVICGAGFELPSEALQLGKRLLVKPLLRQMEQESNAVALQELGYGAVMHNLDASAISAWLSAPTGGRRLRYADVAGCFVEWLEGGNWGDVASLLRATWGDSAPALSPAVGPRRRRAA